MHESLLAYCMSQGFDGDLDLDICDVGSQDPTGPRGPRQVACGFCSLEAQTERDFEKPSLRLQAGVQFSGQRGIMANMAIVHHGTARLYTAGHLPQDSANGSPKLTVLIVPVLI